MTQTQYKVKLVDLSNTFMGYTSGTKASNTGYKVNGVDLNQIYQPYTTGTKADPTYYYVNGNDLCNIFSKISTTVPKSIYAFGIGTTGTVRSIVSDSTNNFYVGGDLFFINGVRVTFANGSGGLGKVTEFTTVSTAFAQGCDDSPYSVTCDAYDNIYAVGWFGSIGPNLDHTTGQVYGTGAMIAKWNGSVWSAIPDSTAGTNGHMEKIVINKSNNNIFYVAGSITNVYYNGTTTIVSNFAMWNGTSWSSLGFGAATTPINRMDVDSTGIIYIINGSDIACYNGSSWSNLTKNNSSGGVVISDTIYDVFVDANDILWAVGSFYLAKYSKITGYWTYIGNPGFTPTRVHGSNNIIYISGATGLANYDGTTLSSNLLTSVGGGSITCLSYRYDKVYLGGTFTSINGVSVSRLASYQ